jgi:hypothetical protein
VKTANIEDIQPEEIFRFTSPPPATTKLRWQLAMGKNIRNRTANR